MIPLTQEQKVYKEKTLQQLLTNRAQLEASLEQETQPQALRTIERQLEAIEDEVSRLQDELSGNVVLDQPASTDLFMQVVKALSKEKFFLAKRYIQKLETIEPFHPALERLKQEAESGRVTRRTRSIAEGKATSYPGLDLQSTLPQPTAGAVLDQPAGVEPIYVDEVEEESPGFFAQFFQFHILVSCLVVMVLLCVMFGVGGVSILEWLIEGG